MRIKQLFCSGRGIESRLIWRRRVIHTRQAIDADEEELLQRQSVAHDEEGDKSSSSATSSDKPLADLKVAIYANVTRSLKDSIYIDDICINVDDRALVGAVPSLFRKRKPQQTIFRITMMRIIGRFICDGDDGDSDNKIHHRASVR